MRLFSPKARGLRRLGFVATMASGLSLLGIGVSGVAAIDDRLEVASSGPVDVRFIDYRQGPHDRPCRRDPRPEEDES